MNAVNLILHRPLYYTYFTHTHTHTHSFFPLEPVLQKVRFSGFGKYETAFSWTNRSKMTLYSHFCLQSATNIYHKASSTHSDKEAHKMFQAQFLQWIFLTLKLPCKLRLHISSDGKANGAFWKDLKWSYKFYIFTHLETLGLERNYIIYA